MWENIEVLDDKLINIDEYKDAIVLADFERGGVYKDGELISLTTRAPGCCEPQGENRFFDVKKESFRYLEGNYLYLGIVQLHYGHFLVNTMSRFWIFLESKKYIESSLKFILSLPCPYKDLPKYIIDIIDILPIDKERIIFLYDEAIKVEHLIVPKPTYVSGRYISRKFKATFDFIGDKFVEDAGNFPQKIYLGREKLSKHGIRGIGYNNNKAPRYEFGEKVIRKQFENNGFFICYPEELTIAEQISLFRNADVIACGNGTIGHNILWSKKNIKLIYLERYPVTDPDQFYINTVSTVEFFPIKCWMYKSSRAVNCMKLSRDLKKYASSNGYHIKVTLDIIIDTFFAFCRYWACKIMLKMKHNNH